MKPFIPPKNNDIDFNDEIDSMIQDGIERRLYEERDDFDLRLSFEIEERDTDCDDLKDVL